MKVLLIQPRNRSYVITPSLGLGYLAAVLRNGGHDVALLNCHQQDVGIDEIILRIRQQSIAVVGLQLFTYDMGIVCEYVSRIKRAIPEVVLMAGGPHPSADPHGTLALLPEVEFVFVGEAERGLPLLLAKLAVADTNFANVPGLTYRVNGRTVQNPPEFVRDLDSLSFPAWDLLEPERYPEAPHGAFFKSFPVAPIIISRGCPCACSFCAGRTVSGGLFRIRSVENVIQELRVLKARGIREFHVEDENLTLSRDFLFGFCSALVRERLGMNWSLPSGVRIDTLDEEMVNAMRNAGCYAVAIGIEFGSQRLLNVTGKNLTLATIRQKVTLLKRSGVKTTGFFLFGLPGSTFAEMEETLAFALSLPLDRAQFNNYMPLPGTPLWDELNDAGKLKNLRWENCFVHGVSYVDNPGDEQRLKRLQRKAYLKFYLRPRIALGVMKEVRSMSHLFFLLRRLADALRLH